MLARWVNRLLAPLDVAVTRRTTLERTRALLEEALAQRSRAQEAQASPSMAEALMQRIESMQRRQQTTEQNLLRRQNAVRWSLVDTLERHVATLSDRRVCVLCGHDDLASSFGAYRTHCIFGGGDLLRHQCPNCDVIFGPDKMFALSEQELAQEYEWHYQVYEEGDSTALELRAFHSLAPHKDGLYINYGAGGWSHSVRQLRDEGWNVMAYEPHGSASRQDNWVLTSEAQVAELRPDGLFSNNVLEHLRRPVEDLRRMASWLKPGARMAHATPCYEYLYEFTRFHLFFFPGRSRELLARLAGLQVEQFEVDGHYMNCVFGNRDAAPSI